MKKRIQVMLTAMMLAFSFTGTVSAEYGVIPDHRLLSRLEDWADLLTDEEEANVLSALDEISERQNLDVAIVSVNTLEGKTPTEYADDYFDYNGFGMGEGADGIVLLISMEDRDWRISTHGYGLTAFTDAGQEYMAEQFLPDLSDGDYESAFMTYANLCDDFITQARTGKPYDTGNMPKKPFDALASGLISLVVGFIISLVLALIQRSKLNSVRKNYSANNYTVPGSFHLTGNFDTFLRNYVTTRHIETSNSSGGGSSSHTSSSGRSHGGSGGKF